MYLMYVDESGDCGLPSGGSPTSLFCLSGVVVHELAWRDTIDQLLQFRRWLKRRYGIFLEAEIHSAELITKPGRLHASFQSLAKHQRLAIIRHFADEIAQLQNVRLINVTLDKTRGIASPEDAFNYAWCSLFQRFENTIQQENFPGPQNPQERGIVFPDNTDGGKLRRLLAKMRINNLLKINLGSGATTYINRPLRFVIEDPVVRDSRESYLIQVADCAAFLLKQYMQPNGYMRRHGGNAYFERLTPVLCKEASRKAPSELGIVRLPG
ncbi:MAG: DUF3800 domain-containing protein [Pirellulaceae bacterium]